MAGTHARIIKSDFRGLDQLVKTLGDGQVVRVGILANKANRNEAGKLRSLKAGGGHRIDKTSPAEINNAELGAIHEFGSLSRGIPKRSWLRMPIFQNAKDIIADAAKVLPEAVASGSMTRVLRIIGISAQAQIQKAFASRGFGRWRPDAPSTRAAKHSNAPLIDTGQLRRSVTSAVVKP
jgi:phage gpG-like protein